MKLYSLYTIKKEKFDRREDFVFSYDIDVLSNLFGLFTYTI